MTSRYFGWLKDKYDRRDFLYKATFKAIPDTVVLREFLPGVRDQGTVSSCVGFGARGIGIARDKRLGTYIAGLDYSPTWIYNWARAREGTLLSDCGCYPRNAFHMLYLKGFLPEEFWPYNPNKLDTTYPPSHLEPEAAKYPLLSYYRVVDGTIGIREAIADGKFVFIGTPWFEKWLYPDNGVLEEVSVYDKVIGGHATALYGYEKSTNRFYGMNSWGGSWGREGLYTMPFQAFNIFKKLGGYDAYYIGDFPASEPDESGCKFSRAVAKSLNFLWKGFSKKTRFVAQGGR